MKDKFIKVRITDEKREAYKNAVGDMSKDLIKHIDKAIKADLNK